MRATIKRKAYLEVVLTQAAMLATLICLYFYFKQHPNYMAATPDLQKGGLAIMIWLIAVVLTTTIGTTFGLTTTITEEEDRYMETRPNVKHIILPNPRNEGFEQYIIQRMIDNNPRMPDEKGTMLFIKLIKEQMSQMFLVVPVAVAFIAPCFGDIPVLSDKAYTIPISILALISFALFIIQLAKYQSKLRNEYDVLRLIKEAEKLRRNNPGKMAKRRQNDHTAQAPRPLHDQNIQSVRILRGNGRSRQISRILPQQK